MDGKIASNDDLYSNPSPKSNLSSSRNPGEERVDRVHWTTTKTKETEQVEKGGEVPSKFQNEPQEPTDKEMFDYSGQTIRDSNDSKNFIYSGISLSSSKRKLQKTKEKCFNPCYCCPCGNLRIWCFVVSVFEIIIFFILMTITTPLAIRADERMGHQKGGPDDIEIYNKNNTQYKYAFQNMRDLYYYYVMMSVCSGISVILALVLMAASGWGYKYLCLVYAILKPGPLIAIPAYVFSKGSARIHSEFGYYLLFWIPEIFFIVCSIALFLQFRAGEYSLTRVTPTDFYISESESTHRVTLVERIVENPDNEKTHEIKSKTEVKG